MGSRHTSQIANLSAPGVTTPKRILELPSERMTCQLTLKGAGPVSAQAVIEVSNDAEGWCSSTESTFTLEGTDRVSKAFFVDTPWAFIRTRLDAISGVDANLTVTICTGRNL